MYSTYVPYVLDGRLRSCIYTQPSPNNAESTIEALSSLYGDWLGLHVQYGKKKNLGRISVLWKDRYTDEKYRTPAISSYPAPSFKGIVLYYIISYSII